jgi:hypothetical protein
MSYDEIMTAKDVQKSSFVSIKYIVTYNISQSAN